MKVTAEISQIEWDTDGEVVDCYVGGIHHLTIE